MKLKNYYTLSGLNFATLDSFEDVQKESLLTLEFKGQPYQWKMVIYDSVSNFRNYQPTADDLIVFSNMQSDQFMILHKS